MQILFSLVQVCSVRYTCTFDHESIMRAYSITLSNDSITRALLNTAILPTLRTEWRVHSSTNNKVNLVKYRGV